MISETLAWNAEVHLRLKIGEVVAVGPDGRISIRFDNGKFLRGRTIESFEFVPNV